jgi:hypothetical protein
LISPTIKKLFDCPNFSTLKWVYEGVTLFVKNKVKKDEYPAWRLSNDGLAITRQFLESN